MKQRPRIYYTETQKALMWERWQKGDSLQQIAQLFDRNHSSVQRILAETGGIWPAQRCRSRLVLTLPEREEISRAVVAGHSIRSIARQLGRAPSTISREIDRNGGQDDYRASQADEAPTVDIHNEPDDAEISNRCTGNRHRVLVDYPRIRLSPLPLFGRACSEYIRLRRYKPCHQSLLLRCLGFSRCLRVGMGDFAIRPGGCIKKATRPSVAAGRRNCVCLGKLRL